MVLVRADCPFRNNQTPCSCDVVRSGISVACTGPASLNAISTTLGSISEDQTWELQLDSVDLAELPPAVQNVQSLRLSHSKIGRLQNFNPITWPKLNELVIETVTMINSPWLQLQGAHHLRYLKVSSYQMRQIGSDFREGVPAGVRYLDLRKTETTNLQPNSMSHLVNLIYLLMVDVPVREFPRNALPLKIPELHTFILGNTQIEKLEENFFEGMPKLEVLMLNGNKLVTLDSQLFAPLTSHLTHLLAERNPLVCDCGLLWVKKTQQNKQSMKVLASCYDNAAEEFKEVTALDESQYCL